MPIFFLWIYLFSNMFFKKQEKEYKEEKDKKPNCFANSYLHITNKEDYYKLIKNPNYKLFEYSITKDNKGNTFRDFYFVKLKKFNK